MSVVVGSTTYSDAGATATDNIDGNITANIVTVNPVNVNATGTYTVTYNVSDASGNPSVQVTRTVNVISALPTFSITTTVSGSGSITPSGTVNVTQGNNQLFTITPNPSNVLVSLVVDGVVTPATTTINFTNVQATHTIDATFAPTGSSTQTITSTAGPNGVISPLGTINVVNGSNQPYTITPNAGYIIESVTVDGFSSPVNNSYLFSSVLAPHTINVTFSAAPVTIINSTINGTYYASSYLGTTTASALGINGTSTIINS
jgi:hypothetical protein